MPGKTLRKMKNALCQDILQLPFSRFLLKLNHVGHHVVFFQLIEAIYQLQTLEEQEAHLLFNITSPGVPRLHIDDFKSALFRKDFWIFWCFWKRAFLKRTLVSSLFFPSLDDFGNVFVWLCLKTTSVLTSSRSQCPPMTPRTSVGTIDLKILSERSHPRDLIGGF